MRYFFHIAYHGRQFRGWQRQPDVNSVQEVLERTLSNILKKPIAIVGCGRTDAEVHAAQFFFHLDLDQWPTFDLLFRLNKSLPEQIAVFDIIPVETRSHARFDAIQRKYDYFIHTQKDPFLRENSSFYQIETLDFEKMKVAAALLPTYRDYRAFCTQPDKNEHTLCKVSEALFYRNVDGSRIRFHITSNRFLAKMIRILVGKLLKIGQGELSIDEFESHLITLEPPKLFEVAHPTGLFLSKVTYPYLNLKPRANYMLDLRPEDWVAI